MAMAFTSSQLRAYGRANEELMARIAPQFVVAGEGRFRLSARVRAPREIIGWVDPGGRRV